MVVVVHQADAANVTDPATANAIPLVNINAPAVVSQAVWANILEIVDVFNPNEHFSDGEPDALRSRINDDMRKSITFIVTKDCQLACKYCYLVGKNPYGKMDFETARKAVDFVLSDPLCNESDSVQFEFIGGEPFIEIDLIDKICDYIKLEMYRRNHKWFDDYVFLFTSNGINYHSEKVREYIHKNRRHLEICITIDGTRKKHDLNRVYKNTGKGSYDDVVRNVPLWLEEFPGIHTKVTISSADIPYIKESVLHIYDLGISGVMINCVFEDVWNPGDDKAFEQQLIELADEIIDRKLYETHVCSFFDEKIGKPFKDDGNWCGAGMMLSVDSAGNFYPCTRFAAYSLREKQPIIIGNINDGINEDLLRPFLTLKRSVQSPRECMECDVASGCAWCQGENYDAALTETINQRAVAICKMHKAQVRANNYYWSKLFRSLEDSYGSKDLSHVARLRFKSC